MNVIEFNNVWEKYRIKFIIDEKVSWEEIWALDDVNVKVDKGEVVGIIGHNGAGKTTLLRLISGMLIPDKGKINVHGRVSTLMELGAGFNPEFTGTENIIINARMYGLDKDVLEQQMAKIIEFADLGRFIDAPIKYYSQGMYMRLAFALAIFVEPDILLIDDILAVGDEEARQKCIKKIFELKGMGKTIILVSHDMGMVTKLCNRVILLEKGKIIKEGMPEKVIQHYLETVGNKDGIAILEKDRLRVVFNNGRTSLSYDTNLLTKGMGGYVVFLDPSIDSWLSSFNLSWQIKNLSTDKIIVEGRSSDGAFLQLWTLQLLNEGLRWKVEMKEGTIKEAHIDLPILPQYKKWLSLEKEEDFPPFVHRDNWQDIGLNKLTEGMLGVTQVEETQGIPSMILEVEGKDSKLRLFNTGYEQETRIIQAHFDRSKIISVDIRIFPAKEQFEDYIEKSRQTFLLKQQAEEEKLRLQRTISSGNLRLFADLENKAIRLYYKDREITAHTGLSASFLINKTWYDISSAEWQITNEKDALLLKFFWKSFDLTQTWKVFFREKALLWQADCSCKASPILELLKFGLSLRPEYKTFFCGHQQAQFPEEFTVWQDISVEASQSELFGLRKANELPAVTLKNKDNLTCIVQNSDSSFSCRVLQLALPKELMKEKGSFGTELSILEDETLIDNYVKEKKGQLLLKQQAEKEKLRLQRTISSGNLRLFADLENKAIRLYYKDREITKGIGLYASFCASQKRFHLDDAQWHIQKISETKLILILNYTSLSLLQFWTLSCKEDGALDIKIEIESNGSIYMTNCEVVLELQDKYKDWRTVHEQGDFLVKRYINNIAPIRLKDSKVSKVFLRSETNESIPNLFFEVSSQLDNRILSIYKRYIEKNNMCICLDSSLIIPKKEELIRSGRHSYFEGRIVLDKDIKITEGLIVNSSPALNRDKLSFVFDRGIGRIFWEQRELTAGLGVYASVRSLGIWYDSYQASWQIHNKEKNKICVSGDWSHIPISQIWQIELINENIISWKVDIEILEEVNLEIEQANLMLSSEYKNWIIPGFHQGEFLDEYTQDYDIIPFRFWYGKSREIGAKAKILPKIIFKSDMKDGVSRAIVENTDYFYRARLLQYQKTNSCNLLPGKYLYFKGVAEIEPEG